MESTRFIVTALQRVGTLAALTVLAACGGSGSDDDSQCGPLLAVMTAGLACIGKVTTSPPPPPPPPASAPPPPPASAPPPQTPPSSNTVVMARHVEYEPNNTLDNANPVSFRSAPIDDHIGIEITGDVNLTDDEADFFIFTPPRTGPFLVYLCSETCTEPLQSDEVYLMVYDQSQSTIASTPMGSVETQQFSVELTAGMAYYVEVNGYKSGTSPVAYKLVLID